MRYTALILYFSSALFLPMHAGTVRAAPPPPISTPIPSVDDKEIKSVYVRYVIDGDTVVLVGGERVRYVGLDTPERGEPFYEEARARNMALVMSKKLRLLVCLDEPKDKYGRTLAWVWTDDVFVNVALVREGLAKTLAIPPCGRWRRKEFKEAERRARETGLGIWRPE